MEKFELVFQSAYDDGTGDLQEGDEWKRVIGAQNLLSAEKIAKAMLGEEIAASEWLNKVIRVKKTDKTANLYTWGDGTDIWNRVFERTGINPDHVTFIEVAGQKVGFMVNKPR